MKECFLKCYHVFKGEIVKKNYFVFLSLLFFCLISCRTAEITENDGQNADYFITSFGKFLIPDGFIKYEKLSDRNKYFFVEEERQKVSGFADNISVEMGKTEYAVSEHPLFRQDISRRLFMQFEEYCATSDVTGSCFTTDEGFICYRFSFEKDGLLMTQYYIIYDNYAYVLVHETVSKPSYKMDEATLLIVNSYLEE